MKVKYQLLAFILLTTLFYVGLYFSFTSEISLEKYEELKTLAEQDASLKHSVSILMKQNRKITNCEYATLIQESERKDRLVREYQIKEFFNN